MRVLFLAIANLFPKENNINLRGCKSGIIITEYNFHVSYIRALEVIYYY
jgi:hypothetical protein